MSFEVGNYRADWLEQIEILKTEIEEKQRQIEYWEKKLEEYRCVDGKCW